MSGGGTALKKKKSLNKSLPTRIKCFPPSLATQLRTDTTMMSSLARQLPKLFFTQSPGVGAERWRLVLPAALSLSVCLCVCVHTVSADRPVSAQSSSVTPLLSALSAFWLFIPPQVSTVKKLRLKHVPISACLLMSCHFTSQQDWMFKWAAQTTWVVKIYIYIYMGVDKVNQQNMQENNKDCSTAPHRSSLPLEGAPV